MKPERLTLLNIGPFTGRHEIDFTGLGDIFLVYGKTGAGKTTIFDSLSYVFYGEVPGARKGLTLQMRSQFAPEDEQSAVELEFSLSLRRYRVRRTLPSERAGIRTEKIQKIPEEVTFEEWDGSAWKDRSSANKSDTDRMVRELIGLSAEEFSRIVLLPQGEFAQFLRQKTTERKQVLAKLFPIDDHLAVMETAKTRAKESRLRLEGAEKALTDFGAEFNRENSAERSAVLRERLSSLKQEQERDRLQLKKLAGDLENARAHAARLQERNDRRENLARLETEGESISYLGRELAAARKAEPIALRLASLTELTNRLALIRQEISQAQTEASVNEETLRRLGGRIGSVEAAEREKSKLQARKELLQVAADIARELEGEQAALEEVRSERDRLAARLNENRKETKKTAEALTALEPVIATFDERSADKENAQTALERAKRLKVLAEDYAKEKLALQAHESAAAGAKKELDTTERDLEIARAAVEDLEAQIGQAAASLTAAELAAGLINGTPCPVCGSLEHPSPAAPSSLDRYSLTERLESEKRNLERLEGERRRRAEDWAGKNARRGAAEETANRSIERYCLEAGLAAEGGTSCIPREAIPSPEQAVELLKSAAAAMQGAVDSLTAVNRAMNEHRALLARQKALAADADEARNLLAKSERETAEKETTVRHRIERYREAFPAEDAVVPAPAEAEEALERCTDSIFRLEAEIEAYHKETKAAENRRAALSARLETLAASEGEGEKTLCEAQAALAAECAAAGFADGESARAAARTGEFIAAAENRLEGWNRSVTETKSLLSRLEEELERWTGPDIQAAEGAAAELETKISARDSEIESLSAELTTVENLSERWKSLEAERVRLSAEALRYDRLYRDLWGSNPQKIPFDAWILGMYLEEIARFANARLERMSDGRYLIRVNDSYRTGNAMAGLELEILDSWTGRSRPAGTLSGGETFMASISLALGLADSIQSRSGGIQLDAVFIDEGFGSLDEASLERAISILDEIRGSRTVGLISHVGELKNRIPNRIEVVKTASGSTIKKETYP